LSSAIELIGNTFSGNIASQTGQGTGGGVLLYNCGNNSQILSNNFINNSGTTSTTYTGWGGGMGMNSDDSMVHSNAFENNTASPVDGNSKGSALFQWYGAPTISNNVIVSNQRGSAVYLGFSNGTFEANRVHENNGTIGLELWYAGAGSGVTITNNIIAKSGTTYSVYGSGTVGNPLTARLYHNTLVGDSTQYGIFLAGYGSANMTNNIVANHTVTGVTKFLPAFTLTQDHTLFWGNASDGERGTSPVDGDPAFINALANDYRINPNSAAKDAGAVSGVTNDIDNDTRPWGSGYDIGADEFVVRGNAGTNLLLLED
jgi:hypothetical protein